MLSILINIETFVVILGKNVVHKDTTETVNGQAYAICIFDKKGTEGVSLKKLEKVSSVSVCIQSSLFKTQIKQ